MRHSLALSFFAVLAVSDVLVYSTSPIDLSNLPTVLQNLSATIFPTLKPIAVNMWNNPQLSGSETFAHDQVVEHFSALGECMLNGAPRRTADPVCQGGNGS